MQLATNSPIHFKGLNGLRFLAAFSVLVGHVELIKRYLGLPNESELFERINFGGIGVYFFFVLSGFLITYLLCAEKKQTGQISIRLFYMRRILRIWPLYYLIVIVGFFILPQFPFFHLFRGSFDAAFNSNLILYLLILPNLAFALNGAPVPHIGQAWSIGVEEQFYLFWPLLVKHSINLLRAMLVTLVIILLVKAVILLLPYFAEITWTGFGVLAKFIASCKFESMAIGAIGAWALIENKTKLLDILFHPFVFWSSLLLFPLLSYFAFPYAILQDGIHVPMSAMFLVIIINVAANGKLMFLEMRFLDYFGRISYGIYMYHLAIVFATVKLVHVIWGRNDFWGGLFTYSGSVLLSIFISHMSYKFFERWFVKKKERFSKVLSN